MTFLEEIDNDEKAVLLCHNRYLNKACGAHLLRTINVIQSKPEMISAEDDNCINIYDEPESQSAKASSSAKPVDGCRIRCMKCDGVVGQRNGTQIDFHCEKLKETYISDWDGCVNEIFNEVD